VIKYEQVMRGGRELKRLPSEEFFIFHLEKAFEKGFPVELDADSIERLKGIGATYADPEPFRELIRAIRALGTIKIWREKDAT
jgi:hypothetical protein